ncbi:MAG: hypothetical protein JXA33_17255 [Anaerolineae bacterium]|nr:hypothetical protein [Anaerolineae bacterium]
MNNHFYRIGLLGIFIAITLSLSFFLLNVDLRDALFHITGEERLVPQLRGIAQWGFRWTRPLPRTADEVAVMYTDLPPFGINTFLEQEVEPEKRAYSLQMIADAGFYWIRQSFPWYDIEIHGKGDFEDRRHEPYRSAWEKYDNIVELTENYGLHLIVRLEAPPEWSHHNEHTADADIQGDFGPPVLFEDYGDYVSAVVTRYRGRIRFYQIWNEPNIYPEWGNQPVNPEAYTELLCLAYQRVKEADPEAVVISGAMAPTAELGTWNSVDQGNNLMDVVFLQRMYNAGAGNCFDIMAVNDYMLWSGPTDHRMRPTQDQVNFARPLWVRDVMVANGDAHKPIWISEMNSNAAPESIPPRFGRVTLDQQARYAPLAYERIQREWPWAGVTTVWFFKRANDTEREQAFYYFRLAEPDFTPLSIYHSLSTYLTTFTPTLYPGRHQETTWQLDYTGLWQDKPSTNASLGSYRQTTDSSATLTFTWEGRNLMLIPGPEHSVLHMSEEGKSYEVHLKGSPVTLARHIKSKPRTVTLSVIEGIASVDEIYVR